MLDSAAAALELQAERLLFHGLSKQPQGQVEDNNNGKKGNCVSRKQDNVHLKGKEHCLKCSVHRSKSAFKWEVFQSLRTKSSKDQPVWFSYKPQSSTRFATIEVHGRIHLKKHLLNVFGFVHCIY